MKTFEVKVYRDGKWWMIEIPEIDGLTQARRLGEVEDMARSFIAVDQDLAPSSIELRNPQVVVAGKDLAATMREILELRAAARKAEEQVAALMVETARNLANAEVPLRDIGSVLDVSHQRVHQLLHVGAPADLIAKPSRTGKGAAASRTRSAAGSAPSGRYAPTRAAAKTSGQWAKGKPKAGTHVKR